MMWKGENWEEIRNLSLFSPYPMKLSFKEVRSREGLTVVLARNQDALFSFVLTQLCA